MCINNCTGKCNRVYEIVVVVAAFYYIAEGEKRRKQRKNRGRRDQEQVDSKTRWPAACMRVDFSYIQRMKSSNEWRRIVDDDDSKLYLFEKIE